MADARQPRRILRRVIAARRRGRPHLRVAAPPQPPCLCRTCGAGVTAGYNRYASCKVSICTEELIKAGQNGRLASHGSEAEAKRAENRRRHAAALRARRPSDQPAWLDQVTYLREIQPRLLSVTVPAIRTALGLSKAYVTNIRCGKRLPHPRHWRTLAQLIGISEV
jgi:hypothetical protein